MMRTLVAALVIASFAGQALAQAGTMQPIPNPPEKHKATEHHKKAPKKADADYGAHVGDDPRVDKPGGTLPTPPRSGGNTPKE